MQLEFCYNCNLQLDPSRAASLRRSHKMHMGMDDPSVANLPLGDSRCVAAMENCLLFWAAENRSQEVPFAIQFKYEHWATCYYVFIIAIFMVGHANNLWNDHRRRAEVVVDV